MIVGIMILMIMVMMVMLIKIEDKGANGDDDVTILNDGGHLMTKLFAGLDKQPNLFTQWPTHR